MTANNDHPAAGVAALSWRRRHHASLAAPDDLIDLSSVTARQAMIEASLAAIRAGLAVVNLHRRTESMAPSLTT